MAVTAVIATSADGDGIPERIMEHLFEPFQSTKDHGSGLGIFAAKHILEMHRGSMDIKSERGQGTTVTITLPVHQRPIVESDQSSSGNGTQHLARSR